MFPGHRLYKQIWSTKQHCWKTPSDLHLNVLQTLHTRLVFQKNQASNWICNSFRHYISVSHTCRKAQFFDQTRFRVRQEFKFSFFLIAYADLRESLRWCIRAVLQCTWHKMARDWWNIDGFTRTPWPLWLIPAKGMLSTSICESPKRRCKTTVWRYQHYLRRRFLATDAGQIN